MEKTLLENQILILESNLAIMNLDDFNTELKLKLKERIMFLKGYLRNLV